MRQITRPRHVFFDSDEFDYKDGLIHASVEALQVDTIIPYDQAAFKTSFIPKLTAEEANEKLFGQVWTELEET